MKKYIFFFLSVLLLGGSVVFVFSCPVEFTFRAYLDKRFWQPFSKYEKALEKARTTAGKPHEQPANPDTEPAFAGMEADEGGRTLSALRDAYQEQDYSGARKALAACDVSALNEKEQEELRLIAAKLDLREGEMGEPVLLQEAKVKLHAFLNTAKDPRYLSEARGWLARCWYLLGDHAVAAKIYLAELERGDSIFSRTSLIQSLRMLFPYNGSAARLSDHLEEFFDTPAHALFAVNLVTNPIYYDKVERAAMAGVAQKALAALQAHKELFCSGPDSEALILALMRAALYMGDTAGALVYSERLPQDSAVKTSPEFCWMKAACFFLGRKYAAAEGPLLQMFHSSLATDRDRSAAAQGLVGVYWKLQRPADQLHWAFLAVGGRSKEQIELEANGILQESPYLGFLYWPAGSWLFDLPYLLDIQLTDRQLREYLDRFAEEDSSLIIQQMAAKPNSAPYFVEYTFAVRLARSESYAQAAQAFERLGNAGKAQLMRKLAGLYAAAHDISLTVAQHRQALYDYADFLETHSTQVFFNDILWMGFQTWAFLGKGRERPSTLGSTNDEQGLTFDERKTYLELERKLQDTQEERWRAYLILKELMTAAGHSELGNRAAKKAITCLARINQERFGRSDDINEGLDALRQWLRTAKK